MVNLEDIKTAKEIRTVFSLVHDVAISQPRVVLLTTTAMRAHPGHGLEVVTDSRSSHCTHNPEHHVVTPTHHVNCLSRLAVCQSGCDGCPQHRTTDLVHDRHIMTQVLPRLNAKTSWQAFSKVVLNIIREAPLPPAK